ncbi:MAG: hypothetical protein ACK4PN_08370 [Allorhizobium sp.]
MTARRKPLDSMENTLVDLRALIKLGLTVSEHVEPDELSRLAGELHTLFYLMLDKVEAAAGDTAALFRAEYATIEGDRLQ